MLTQSADHHFFLCVPNKYLVENRYEEKLEKYEEKLIDETLKPFVPSGHAFVCFDSINAVQLCEKHYSVGPFDYIKYLFFWVGNRITTCCGLFSNERENNRLRSASTFSKFDHVSNMEVLSKYGQSVLSMRKLTEPYDILWKNLTGVQGHFLLRRMMFFVAGLLIIIFVSSPTVLFANIKKFDDKNYFDFEWIENSKVA